MSPEVRQRLNERIDKVIKFLLSDPPEPQPTVFEAEFTPRFWRPQGFKVMVVAKYRNEAIASLKQQGYPIARICAMRHQCGAEWVEHPLTGIKADVAELS